MRITSKCKICRRLGQKLFLKEKKCFSPKCPLLRKPYLPGKKGKRKAGGISEYGRELLEKQKLKTWYGVSERQFKNYIKEILSKRGRIEDAALELIKKLEKRLDNVVFRLGLAASRFQARQLVNHGHFFVNGKPINIPSYQLKKGDLVSIRPGKKNKTIFKNLKSILKEKHIPGWLQIDKEKLEGKVVGEPDLKEAGVPVEISAVFEFYSR